MNFWTYVVVMAGGACGTLARYVVSDLALPLSRQLPFGTMMINVTGSFLIGLFGTLTLAHGKYPVPENLRMFVMVGFCGGYTTFSSFSLQTLDLMRSGLMSRAVVNVVASVVLCIAAVALGHWFAARLNGGAVAITQYAIEEEA
jgi:fluoride exporter